MVWSNLDIFKQKSLNSIELAVIEEKKVQIFYKLYYILFMRTLSIFK